MKAIVAVDKNWGIGKKNDLLFSLPADMAYLFSFCIDKDRQKSFVSPTPIS